MQKSHMLLTSCRGYLFRLTMCATVFMWTNRAKVYFLRCT